ncbi:hypothetical protein [Curtobacterium sp. SORGH_AS_0776]|uniref:hypothetical protein n=1 Tax=Curtobacterium sp. SORGH_AS_0776 TaxID=3041798 RepID=UPI00285D0A22|nr:hypothetical protein [Curtobacterium sp. SORGH_AS_0776]MDR6169096.1 hypothetical protein [Curtobacterium sp. SORGH_AS_0776]
MLITATIGVGLALALAGCSSPGSVCADYGQGNTVNVVVPDHLATTVESVAVCVGADCTPEQESATSEVDGATWTVPVEQTQDERGRVALFDADGARLDERGVELAWTDYGFGAPLQCRGSGVAEVWLD